MLSILIPIYNFEVSQLVNRLVKQCRKAKITYEVLCFDDGSRQSIKEKNQVLRSAFHVNYVEMSENLGRAKIRNWLAKAASHEFLLFIDCDSKVPSSDYIKNYVGAMSKHDVIYGGRSYTRKAPRSVKKKLHWLYGSKREAISARKRSKQPYLNFMSNNFIIRREIFEHIKLDENLVQYGYEDTLFALALKGENIGIKHIDNPLQHKGLETTKTFLKKQTLAMENLASLYKHGLIKRTRLIQFYERAKYWKLLYPLFNYFEKNQEKIISNLNSSSPKLIYLQLFKLVHFHKELTGIRD